MGFWDTLIGRNKPKAKTETYASVYPLYEQQTPQYPLPNPYPMIRQGYKLNELVFACVNKRMTVTSEPPMRVYRDNGDSREEISDHPLRALLRRPNERMSERDFWSATMAYLLIAGFAAWEIELNNAGEPIALWPMRPDWCSFYRGDGRPLRAVRYQPYGLPPVDIPIEKVLLFQLFDPEFPMLRGYGPTATALRMMGVDNNATDFLKVFFQRGTKLAGLLKTAQTLGDTEAQRIKERWRDTHGGVENWGDIAVLGNGAEFQSIQMNFRDMEFPELDARSEGRICMLFKTPPILIGAKIGLDRSTFSNFGEARSAFYEDPIMPDWAMLSAAVEMQLMPYYGEDPDIECAFDTSKVKALQEDQTAIWTRATTAAQTGVITRDEAREQLGLDPIDKGESVFLSGPDAGGASSNPIPPGLAQYTGLDMTEDPSDTEDMPPENQDAEAAAQEAEVKKFRAFAKTRIKEGKLREVQAFPFKFTPPAIRSRLIAEVLPAKATPFQDYPEKDA
jgi:HK97 family phage portal protein